MDSFFPMNRSEAATLLFLVAFAAFAFIPAWRTSELWGMAVFGWLVAALMIVSPTIALATFWFGRRDGDSDADAPGGEDDDDTDGVAP